MAPKIEHEESGWGPREPLSLFSMLDMDMAKDDDDITIIEAAHVGRAESNNVISGERPWSWLLKHLPVSLREAKNEK